MPARLVDQPVHEAFAVDRLPVHAYFLIRRDARAQLAHYLPGERDSAGEHQLFAVPSRAQSGMRQIFVDAFHG